MTVLIRQDNAEIPSSEEDVTATILKFLALQTHKDRMDRLRLDRSTNAQWTDLNLIFHNPEWLNKDRHLNTTHCYAFPLADANQMWTFSIFWTHFHGSPSLQFLSSKKDRRLLLLQLICEVNNVLKRRHDPKSLSYQESRHSCIVKGRSVKYSEDFFLPPSKTMTRGESAARTRRGILSSNSAAPAQRWGSGPHRPPPPHPSMRHKTSKSPA